MESFPAPSFQRTIFPKFVFIASHLYDHICPTPAVLHSSLLLPASANPDVPMLFLLYVMTSLAKDLYLDYEGALYTSYPREPPCTRIYRIAPMTMLVYDVVAGCKL